METSIKARISEDLKNKAMLVLNDCGLTASAAVRLFLEQVVKSQGLPFEVKCSPSVKTMTALQQADEIELKAEPRYHSIEALLEGLSDEGKQEK
ncbi:type II toxin-antitoxin system RelB/DinJ family antitoxin [Candidatus Regiella insecticola]|uniref:Addiction module antitoxin RelB/DinJ family n=1 Tax=Candidatus Regiella insecticola TaxID=138073 RepID=A0A6L2ZS87_9ENTR|nr:type II toxin-antitoxin system RelB/DinJ family antitoxin [Candidatus Regiella insecticola]GFN47275.1 addiction module antitoxin RelB/DinJ family [Candidatus Regiella insecticola]